MIYLLYAKNREGEKKTIKVGECYFLAENILQSASASPLFLTESIVHATAFDVDFIFGTVNIKLAHEASCPKCILTN